MAHITVTIHKHSLEYVEGRQHLILFISSLVYQVLDTLVLHEMAALLGFLRFCLSVNVER